VCRKQQYPLILFFTCSRDGWFGTKAILSRSLSGLVNGNLGITKAYIAEITDSSNRVGGFAILAAAWGAGG
jgi:hypothetical protein